MQTLCWKLYCVGRKKSNRKWNNGPNGPHWPVRPVWPAIPFFVRHFASPPSRELFRCLIQFQQQNQQQRTDGKRGCPGGGSAAECTLEACGSLRSLNTRAFEACRKECQDRCETGPARRNQRQRSGNRNQNKAQQRKQGSVRSRHTCSKAL